MPHFIAQPSPYAQRMLGVWLRKMSGWTQSDRAQLMRQKPLETLRSLDMAKVAYEKGKTLGELRGTGFAFRNRYRILDKLADALAENLRLGVVHGDVHAANIIISGSMPGRLRRPLRLKLIDYGSAMVQEHAIGGDARPLRLKLIDYGSAMPLTGDYLGCDIYYDYQRVKTDVMPMLVRNEKEIPRLRKYFERKFLQRLEEKL